MPGIKVKSEGFSLVELLIAVSVLMVLTVLTISKLGPGSQRYGRDVKRKADLQTIASALEMYRQENRGYPGCSSGSSCSSGEISGLTPTFIGSIPQDMTSGRIYRYTPAGCGAGRCATFVLCMGREKLPDPAPGVLDAACGGNCGGASYPCYELVANP